MLKHIALATVALSLVACQSKEEKAAHDLELAKEARAEIIKKRTSEFAPAKGLFGIEMDKPLNVPVCASADAERNVTQSCKDPNTGDVFLTPEHRPAFLKGNSVHVEVDSHGLVKSIMAFCDPEKSAEVETAMMEKFGMTDEEDGIANTWTYKDYYILESSASDMVAINMDREADMEARVKAEEAKDESERKKL